MTIIDEEHAVEERARQPCEAVPTRSWPAASTSSSSRPSRAARPKRAAPPRPGTHRLTEWTLEARNEKTTVSVSAQLEQAIRFSRMAAEETDPKLKELLENQALAYRKLADKRSAQLKLPPVNRPAVMPKKNEGVGPPS